jgi:subtilisin family serine protease
VNAPLLALVLGAAVASGSFANKLDTESRTVIDYREDRIPVAPAPLVERSTNPRGLALTIRFTHALEPSDLDALEKQGVHFVRHGGEALSIENIYTAWVDWAAIDGLIADSRVVRMEAAVPTHQHPPLDVSGPEVQADEMHLALGDSGGLLTGSGVIIQDLDTGVDVTHPVFFRPDGGSFDWIDVDSDGLFSPGVDAVDLDNDGSHTSSEVLSLLDAQVLDHYQLPWVGSDGILDADIDWLYLDEDGDGIRGSGADMGFTDFDPAFGEPLFIVEDVDGDGDLGLGERLLMLDSSKIIATLDGDDAEEHFTGDIINTEPDDAGHGTSVSGILLGGYEQYRKYRGIAPGASLLLADIYGQAVSHVDAVAWGQANGADIMLHEVGTSRYQFLDGTSNTEVAIAGAHTQGTLQVCPAGNIGENYKHGSLVVPAGSDYGTLGIKYFHAASNLADSGSLYWYLTVLSRDDLTGLELAIKPDSTSYPYFIYPGRDVPLGTSATTDCQNDENGGSIYVCGSSDISSSGTKAWHSYIVNSGQGGYSTPPTGFWQIWFQNTSNSAISLHLWLSDDTSVWNGGVNFYSSPSQNSYYIGDAASSATSPSVVEDCVTVAQYSTRTDTYNGDFSSGSFGLSPSSGQGPRLDGVSLMDVAAPGHFDVLTSASSTKEDANGIPYGEGVFTPFGGTSAAGPHVTASAALLLQALPTLSPDDLIAALRDGAATDSETGTALPDESWGYGKLRTMDSLLAADNSAPGYDLLQSPHALLPEATEIILAPTESLGAPPQASATVDGTAVFTTFTEVGHGLWATSVVSGTIVVQVVLEDLAGNVQ